VTLGSPTPLTDAHDLSLFDSGTPSLDDWLRRRARANQVSGASRCFVVCAEQTVVAYYALATGSVRLPEAPTKFRRNMLDPIPVAVLGRLAVDRAYQGQGLGRALVRDAGLRLVQAAEIIGIRGLLVHAISDNARVFYKGLGFAESPLNPMTLMVDLSDLATALPSYSSSSSAGS
jgi:GNAT superfamily N-acetyltransferase